MTPRERDLEQSAYIRGWNDRATADFWTGLVIGVTVGVIVAWLIVAVV